MKQKQFTIGAFVVAAFVLTFFIQPGFAQNQAIQCGDIIEGEFTSQAQRLNYVITLNPGDSVEVLGNAFGTQLGFMLAIFNPAGEGIVGSVRQDGNTRPEPSPTVASGILSATGNYTIQAYNDRLYLLSFSTEMNYQEGWNSIGSIGAFTLGIRCVLRNGTVIEPGDAAPADDGSNADSNVQPESTFSGYGFPGLVAVDFSEGIQIPLTLAQPQTVPLGGEVTLYTYEAAAEETATLSITRVSGDISIGTTVINNDTNELLFAGIMPSSNNLSVELTFPSAGTYAIGLFRVDTTERTGTSGAVQITLQ